MGGGGGAHYEYGAEELSEPGPLQPVCHYNTVRWALAGGAVKRSAGTYLLGCKMIFCLFKRCQECMRKCVCVCVCAGVSEI